MNKNISKRDYRQRAHSNPFKDTDITIPPSPDSINWLEYFKNGQPPSFLDVGCGYGKFLMLENQNNILGLEIRDKVYRYVRDRINKDSLDNCAIMKTNALLFLPNICHKLSIEKIFILFPDPHFKKRKQKGRVICKQMMHIYAYILRERGRLYISTDVIALFNDMKDVIKKSGLFKEIEDPEDIYFERTLKETDEALRAGIKTGQIFACIFEKIN